MLSVSNDPKAQRSYSPEGEIAVLGGMLIDADALTYGLANLSAVDFYREGNRHAFRAFADIAARGAAVDPVTLLDALDAAGHLAAAGGQQFIASLLDAVPSAINNAYHVGVVKRRALERKAQQAAELMAAHPSDATLLAAVRVAVEAVEAANGPPASARPHAVCAVTAPVPDAPSFQIRGFAPRREIGLLASDGGVGKTTIALAIACACAGGYPLFDAECFQTDRSAVLFISEEDSLGVLLNRAGALIQGHGWDRERVLSNLHFLALEGVCLDDAGWRAHLLAEVARLGAGWLILDPLCELTAAKENANDEAKPIIKFLRQVTQVGACCLLAHHFGKAQEGRRSIDRIRGASAWYSAARFVYGLHLVEGGISIECLKFNRGEKLRPFVVNRHVQADPANAVIWQSARLEYQSVREAEDKRAETFVVAQLAAVGRLNTSELKERAKGTGVSGADVSTALRMLANTGRIRYEAGPRGAKFWTVATLPVDSGQGRQPTLPTLPNVAGQPESDTADLAPIYGAGKVQQDTGCTGQSGESPNPLVSSSAKTPVKVR